MDSDPNTPSSVTTLKEKQQIRNEDKQLVNQSIGQSISQSTNQSSNQSTDQSVNQLTGPIVDRPVAFYIPKIIDKKIDEAVLYYQENRSKKIDRSAVVAALLGDPNIWTHEALARLAGKVIRQLTYRLTSRLTD